jgi:hypothetical protein
VVHNLRATVSILGHLIDTNSSSSNIVDDDAWRKVEDDLINLSERVEHFWKIAWDQHASTATKHEDAIAAAKAEVAPGSPADLKQAEALWSMLRAFVKVAAEECDAARGLIEAGNTNA